jgi:nucleotidyltransferase substrate binding protein (TIGR01987 family)
MGKVVDKAQKYDLALTRLKEAVNLPIVNYRDKAGIIQSFEFTYEMSWKLLKSALEEEAGNSPSGPRSIFKEAYQLELIENEGVWLAIIKDRNLASHTYEEKMADQVIDNVKTSYLLEFEKLSKMIHDKFINQ